MSQQINLLNPALITRHEHFSLLTMLQALGMIALGSLLFYGFAAYRVAELEKQSEQSSRSLNAEQMRLAGYVAEFSPQQASQALQDEVHRMEKLFADQTELVETIKSGALGNSTGYSEYMRAFARQITQGLWLTGFVISSDTRQISLNGAALDPVLLPAYIQRLSRESVMHGKTFTTLQMRRPQFDENQGVRYVEFTLHSDTVSGDKK